MQRGFLPSGGQQQLGLGGQGQGLGGNTFAQTGQGLGTGLGQGLGTGLGAGFGTGQGALGSQTPAFAQQGNNIFGNPAPQIGQNPQGQFQQQTPFQQGGQQNPQFQQQPFGQQQQLGFNQGQMQHTQQQLQFQLNPQNQMGQNLNIQNQQNAFQQQGSLQPQELAIQDPNQQLQYPDFFTAGKFQEYVTIQQELMKEVQTKHQLRKLQADKLEAIVSTIYLHPEKTIQPQQNKLIYEQQIKELKTINSGTQYYRVYLQYDKLKKRIDFERKLQDEIISRLQAINNYLEDKMEDQYVGQPDESIKQIQELQKKTNKLESSVVETTDRCRNFTDQDLMEADDFDSSLLILQQCLLDLDDQARRINLNNWNTLIEENQKNKLNIIKMTDLFLKVSQIKRTINNDLSTLYESKEFSIDMDTENVIQVYQQKKTSLDEQIRSINGKLKEMKQLLEQIQKQMTNQTTNIAQKSYVQNVKEIEKEVQNVYQNKLDKINHDKNQIQIFGKRLTQKLDNIGIQIETGRTLEKSLSSTEESLQIGYEAMASFQRQQNNMRRIQQKMNSLIGDMGLSQGILKIMGGRDKADKRMILILTAILFVYIICLYYAFK